MRQPILRASMLATFAGLAVAACGGGGGGSTGPGNAQISQAVATSIAQAGVGYVGDAVSTFSGGGMDISGLPDLARQAPGSADPRAVLATAMQAAGLHGKALRLAGAPPLYRSGTDCTPVLSGLITGDTATDTDADGIPDSVVATYSGANCTVVDSADSTTFSFVGTMKLVDIGSLYGVRLVLNLTYVLTSPNSTIHLTYSGTYTLTVSSSVADLQNDLSVYDTVNAQGNSTVVISQGNMHYLFTSNGDPIVWGDALPDGTLVITGHIGLSVPGQGSIFAFDMTTPTPLAYSAACDNAGSNPPYTAGHLVGAFTGVGAGAGFSITFTACGTDPTVTTSGTTS